MNSAMVLIFITMIMMIILVTTRGTHQSAMVFQVLLVGTENLSTLVSIVIVLIIITIIMMVISMMTLSMWHLSKYCGTPSSRFGTESLPMLVNIGVILMLISIVLRMMILVMTSC